MHKNKQDSDEALVIRLQAGDTIALTTLVKRWHKLFCDKAYWLVKDKDVAKDIAQDSWTIIMAKIKKLKDPKQFKYWAYRIVCNKATDWLRLRTKDISNTKLVSVNNNEITETYKENTELKRLLLNAITALPNHQRTVLKLFYTESYSLKEISELLQISEGTVKSRLYHAREKLKKTLKHLNYEN